MFRWSVQIPMVTNWDGFVQKFFHRHATWMVLFKHPFIGLPHEWLEWCVLCAVCHACGCTAGSQSVQRSVIRACEILQSAVISARNTRTIVAAPAGRLARSDAARRTRLASSRRAVASTVVCSLERSVMIPVSRRVSFRFAFGISVFAR